MSTNQVPVTVDYEIDELPKVARNLATIREFCRVNGWLRPGTLRYWIFHHERYGFTNCFLHVGGKVLIDIDRFDAWIEAQNESN